MLRALASCIAQDVILASTRYDTCRGSALALELQSNDSGVRENGPGDGGIRMGSFGFGTFVDYVSTGWALMPSLQMSNSLSVRRISSNNLTT